MYIAFRFNQSSQETVQITPLDHKEIVQNAQRSGSLLHRM